ncbi:MAG: hypothetical protein ACXAC2_22525, partial [Candidatus Kariarchaeaceae archaeon]
VFANGFSLSPQSAFFNYSRVLYRAELEPEIDQPMIDLIPLSKLDIKINCLCSRSCERTD